MSLNNSVTAVKFEVPDFEKEFVFNYKKTDKLTRNKRYTIIIENKKETNYEKSIDFWKKIKKFLARKNGQL